MKNILSNSNLLFVLFAVLAVKGFLSESEFYSMQFYFMAVLVAAMNICTDSIVEAINKKEK